MVITHEIRTKHVISVCIHIENDKWNHQNTRKYVLVPKMYQTLPYVTYLFHGTSSAYLTNILKLATFVSQKPCIFFISQINCVYPCILYIYMKAKWQNISFVAENQITEPWSLLRRDIAKDKNWKFCSSKRRIVVCRPLVPQYAIYISCCKWAFVILLLFIAK